MMFIQPFLLLLPSQGSKFDPGLIFDNSNTVEDGSRGWLLVRQWHYYVSTLGTLLISSSLCYQTIWFNADVKKFVTLDESSPPFKTTRQRWTTARAAEMWIGDVNQSIIHHDI